MCISIMKTRKGSIVIIVQFCTVHSTQWAGFPLLVA